MSLRSLYSESRNSYAFLFSQLYSKQFLDLSLIFIQIFCKFDLGHLIWNIKMFSNWPLLFISSQTLLTIHLFSLHLSTCFTTLMLAFQNLRRNASTSNYQKFHLWRTYKCCTAVKLLTSLEAAHEKRNSRLVKASCHGMIL